MEPTAANRPPTEEEWRALHAAAAKVKALEPWRWMLEDDLFGIDNPETGERGYVSVMGNLGEHTGISLYLGDEAVNAFWMLQIIGNELMSTELLLMIPQLQLSWEDRDQLTDEDRAQLKALGLKFRGRGAWPLARATEPGYLPWYIDGDEARFLTHALDQLLVVAKRLREDEDALMAPAEFDDDDRDVYLYRTRDEHGTWRDEWRFLEPEEAVEPTPVEPDRHLLHQIMAKRPGKGLTLEYGVAMLPLPSVEGRGQRPYFPFVALLVDSSSLMILGMQMLSPIPSLEAMQLSIPEELFGQLAALDFRPKQLTIADNTLVGRVAAPLTEAGITVVHAPTPALEQAFGQMLSMMGAAFGLDDPFGEE